MSGLSINFDDKKIKKNIFYRSRKPFNVSDIDVNKIAISKEVIYGTNEKIHLNTLLDILMKMM